MSEQLEKLRHVVDNAEEKVKEHKKKEKIRKEKEEQKKNEFWQEEQEKEEEKLKDAKFIFKWAEEFSSSDQFQRVLRLSQEEHLGRLSQGRPDALEVYGGNWGHRMDSEGRGKWSDIYLIEDGSLRYRAGYKWMYPKEKFELSSPQEMAARLRAAYLKDFRSAIESGQVYEGIESELSEKLNIG